MAALIFLVFYFYAVSTGSEKFGKEEALGAFVLTAFLIAGSFIDHKYLWSLT